MLTGKIKFFNRKKGFGFIIEDESQADVFMHASGLADRKTKIKPKDSVSFEIYEDPKDGRKKATNIQKLQP